MHKLCTLVQTKNTIIIGDMKTQRDNYKAVEYRGREFKYISLSQVFYIQTQLIIF